MLAILAFTNKSCWAPWVVPPFEQVIIIACVPVGFLPIVGFFLVVLLVLTEVGDFTVAEGLTALCPGAWGVLEGVAVGADAIFADPRAIADPEAKPA